VVIESQKSGEFRKVVAVLFALPLVGNRSSITSRSCHY